MKKGRNFFGIKSLVAGLFILVMFSSAECEGPTREEIRQEAYNKGWDDGWEDGHKIGWEEGRIQGFKESYGKAMRLLFANLIVMLVFAIVVLRRWGKLGQFFAYYLLPPPNWKERAELLEDANTLVRFYEERDNKILDVKNSNLPHESKTALVNRILALYEARITQTFPELRR